MVEWLRSWLHAHKIVGFNPSKKSLTQYIKTLNYTCNPIVCCDVDGGHYMVSQAELKIVNMNFLYLLKFSFLKYLFKK